MNTGARFSKGQMLALFTIILPVLLGAMALGADFSVIYFNWSMVQKAADAAALAGASQLTGVTGSAATVKPAAVNYVNGYACLNGIKNGTSTLCTAGASQNGYADNIAFTTVTDTQVSVGIHRSVPYFFGKMIGLQEAGVAANATAAITATGMVNTGLFPIGLQCTEPCSLSSMDPGQTVTFGTKFVGGLAPGNWDWVNVGQGTGASALGSAIQNGASGSYSIGGTINSSPGNKGNAGPVKNGMNARLASCSAASTPLTSSTDPCQNGGLVGNAVSGGGGVPANDPCLVVVPAVDYTGCNGNCSLTIEGFAEIYLEQTTTSTEIDGCFVKSIGPTSTGSAGAPGLGSLGQPVLIN
jgi:Flp pilus assembly protein TadG